MKNLIFLFSMVSVLSVFARPRLTDVTVVEDDRHVVTISYKLADAPGVVTLDIQTNDVATGAWASIGGENITPSLTGKVGTYVENGNDVNVITWRPNESWPGHRFVNNTAKAVLTAWPTNAPPLFMVVDLKAENDRVTYYPDKRSVPGGITNDIYKTDKIVFRKIPAAGVIWQMGAPTTEKHYDASQMLHDVTLTEDYYMACYETTKGYWDAVEAYSRKSLGSALYNCGRVPTDSISASYTPAETNMCPLGRVTYGAVRGTEDAQHYNWPRDGHEVKSNSFFGALRHMAGGMLFDLPTEAQWEFAARAGTSTQTYYGDPFYSDGWSEKGDMDYELVEKYTWTGSNAKVSGVNCCHPVGLKKANDFDLYDVIGNEWEICLDRWKSDLGTDSVVDPTGSDDDAVTARVVRGVSFGSTDWWAAKSAYRWNLTMSDPMWGTIGYGFRIWAPAVVVKQP